MDIAPAAEVTPQAKAQKGIRLDRLGLWQALRVLLSLGVWGYGLWWLVTHGERLWAQTQPWWSAPPAELWAALALLPLNIWLDTAQWRVWTRQGFAPALRQVLTGYALVLPSPNRMGEYAGRLMAIPPNERWQAGWALFQTKLQMWWLVTTGGAVGLGLLAVRWAVPLWLWVALGLGLALLTLALGSADSLLRSGMGWLRKRWPILGGMLGHGRMEVNGTPLPTRLTSLALGGLRYVVFMLQFALFLSAAGLGLEANLLLALSAAIMALKTYLPGWVLYELGLREVVTVAVLGLLALPTLPGVVASLALFLLNVLVPALVGTWVLFRQPQP